jgi:hypothetical protein
VDLVGTVTPPVPGDGRQENPLSTIAVADGAEPDRMRAADDHRESVARRLDREPFHQRPATSTVTQWHRPVRYRDAPGPALVSAHRPRSRPPVLGLPLAGGLATLDRSVAAHYAITPMEVRGRLGDRSPVRFLDWRPGLLVAISPMVGVVLIRPDGTGTDAIGPQGHVRLRSRVGYARHLNTGDRKG